jgi:DHA2 family multidrug resistance protein
LEQFFALKPGIAPAVQRAYGLIYGMLRQQASLLAYVDDFRLLAALTLCCVPFLFLFRGAEKSKSRRLEKSKTP